MLILRYGGDRLRESFQSYCERMELRALLEQWDTGRNLPLTPDNTSYGSKRKVWWRCEKGHNWQAAVHTRTGSGTGCPVCAGKVARAGENDLATLFPELARQWHPTRNGDLTPEQVVPGSHRMVWWVCEKGHQWRASIKSRVAGCGCPVCANREIHPAENDLASQHPMLAVQWHPTKNGSLTPEQIPPGTTRKVWWRCEKGHEWQASVASRVSGCGSRSAQAKSSSLGRTTCKACSRILPRSGTQHATVQRHQAPYPLTAIGRSGGTAKKATTIKRLWRQEPRVAVDVPTVRDGRFSVASMIWLP